MTEAIEAEAALVRVQADGFVGNKATVRVLAVLTRLAAGAESYGVTELSNELGMTKNMVFRALNTLARHGYVVRDPSGTRYQLGPGVLRLAGAGLPDLNLPEQAAPFMRRMRELTGETVTLAVPWERSAVTVMGVRGLGVIARRIPLGRIMPLHISPASRAILAGFPDSAIARYIEQPLESFSAKTLSKPEQIWREVEAVRARGYATVFGDHWRGGNGVAFPLPGSAEFPHGSVTVAGPAERLTDESLASMIDDLRAIVEQLSGITRLFPSEYFDPAD